MSEPVYYIDRQTGERKKEKIYGEMFLHFLYKEGFWNRMFAYLIAHLPLISRAYGFFQRLPCSKKKIVPFIQKYGVDTAEFLLPTSSFSSFDDFFTRKLKPESRPITPGKECAIIPADGRFLFYPSIHKCDGFIVKGQKFSISELVGDAQLAERYAEGSLVLGRLCPTDYHRFHFPCDCTPEKPRLINGPLYSVSPIAVKKNLKFLAENKRICTLLHTELFGKILYIEIGATNVGTIHQTFKAFQNYKKGDEKGFFSFGGSSLVLLFEPNQIQFDQDLLKASSQHVEILCLMGQSLGTKF